MKEVKVVVVDDSPFSVSMISNILTGKGFNVVGSANNLDEAVTAVSELKPDVVTMDMTMPGADGLQCTEAVLQIDPDLKVIIVSSMMDDEIVHKAKKVKVSGYVQKPVDAEELALMINRIMADQEVFTDLEAIYFNTFKESLSMTMNKFLKEVPEFKEELNINDEKISGGFSVVMGIIGKYVGRMLLDMSLETAGKISGHLLKQENPESDYIVNVIAEISNIVAGNACSMLNKTNSVYGFRVAPPTTVYGESIKISRAELSSVTSVIAETAFGEIYMNIGFCRSECNE